MYLVLSIISIYRSDKYYSKYIYSLIIVPLRGLVIGTAMNNTSECMTTVERVQCQGIDIVVVGDHASAAISRSQVTAKFEPSTFGRKTSTNIDAEIEKLWTIKRGQNPRLYNASKFRLGGWRIEGGRWELKVGLTSYKDLCGTSLANDFKHIQNKGLQDFGDRQTYMADPIGVGLLAITSDGYLLVTRRAAWTAEYPGALDRPGGHPEPDHVLQHDGSLKEHLRGRDINEVVMDEVWWSAVAEAEAEVGVKRAYVKEVKWMGIDLNMEAGARPSLEFYARLGIDKDEVLSTYNQGNHPEADENCGLHLISPETLAHIPSNLPPLSHSLPGQEEAWKNDTKRTAKDMMKNSATKDNNMTSEEEAAWLIQEASPPLKAALILATIHNLFQ